MSGISSGIGLISGINTTELIDQLISIEQRPVASLQQRIQAIDVQRTAFIGLSARLLSIRNSVSNFDQPSFFKQFLATSSNESVLVANASEDTFPGTARVRVHSLVSSHSLLTRGFADVDQSSVGVGTISVELGKGRVNEGTDLDALNGGRGVRRGIIEITDRSGESAEIDLRQAFTVEDVIEAINTNDTINVRASATGVGSNGATGDRLVIEDLSEGVGSLIVAEVDGGRTARDLGIAGSVGSSRIDGSDVVSLTMDTLLSSLNDGNGVDRLTSLGRVGSDISFSTSEGDFGVLLTDALQLDANLLTLNNGDGIRTGVIRMTDRTGATSEIDLTNAKTMQEVLDAINDSGLNLKATTVNSHLQITELTEVPPRVDGDDRPLPLFKIEDVTGYTAADFGIAEETEDSAITGRDVSRISTIGDVIRAINHAPGNNALVEASISADGKGIALQTFGFGNEVTVSQGKTDGGRVSQAAIDLGINGATFAVNDKFVTDRLVSGLNTTLLRTLNGGGGAEVGAISFKDGLGQTAEIDFSSAETVQDVVDLINAEDKLGLVASISSSGTGISLLDESGGTGSVVIADRSGNLAQKLNLVGTHESKDGTIESGNLQRKYISRQTPLSDLRGGGGIAPGSFELIDSKGQFHIVNIDETTATIGGVIDAINGAGGGTITARINDNGDGILVTDSADGTLPLKIEDRDGGTTAAQLQLAGTAKDGDSSIDGSYEFRVETGPGTTLEDLAVELDSLGLDISASVLNDGGSINPFSLSITSGVTGRRGELVIDSTGLDLGLDTLSRAQDAVVSVSLGEGASSRLVTSSSNTLDDIIPGVSIDLLSTSDEDIEITADQDVDGIVEGIRSFVDGFNDLQDTINDSTSFNSDTLERGALFGDPVPDQIRNRLQRTMTGQIQGVPKSMSRMFQVGIRVGAGSRLEFDEARFRKALAESPELVEDLFGHPETGFGAVIQETLDGLTDDFDGVLTRKDELLGDQQEVLNDRIERLNFLIGGKRQRLERQFAGLETALASLQGQQNALSQITAQG